MNILMLPGAYDFRNAGDAAALSIALRRIRQLWPDARVEVLTDEPEGLAQRHPDTAPVATQGLHLLFGRAAFLGRFHRYLPGMVSWRLSETKRLLVKTMPAIAAGALRWKVAVTPEGSSAATDFLNRLRRTDLLIASGMAGFNDTNYRWALTALKFFEFAQRQAIRTLLFSQGLGPLSSVRLRRLARRVFPAADFMALREARTGRPLAESLRVCQHRLTITGDDAVELAFERRRASTGLALGVNLRVARSTCVGPTMVNFLRPLLQTFGENHDAELAPVPISIRESGTNDARSIQGLLAGMDDASDGGATLDTPEKVIDQIGRCRVVVSGAYHGAVFALAQGIPTVCLYKSSYSAAKFEGLAELFGDGCRLVSLDQHDLGPALNEALNATWNGAPALRETLVKAAQRQIILGHAAYQAARRCLRPAGQLKVPNPACSAPSCP